MLTKIAAGIAFSGLLCGLVYLGGNVQAQAPAAGTPVDAAACARLATLKLSDASVSAAQAVPAGQFKPPAGAATGLLTSPRFAVSR